MVAVAQAVDKATALRVLLVVQFRHCSPMQPGRCGDSRDSDSLFSLWPGRRSRLTRHLGCIGEQFEKRTTSPGAKALRRNTFPA